ncbi:unnamed protein product [Lepeophtheirus salmonis]|uniref:(salmon louse) hypothetical protein n=2 Tax=Lepeophtheirus salmonis TaxID=72036 RepID=A0A7R8H722_LEPSM|nr:unnamed protein product [Lepeophtheirus salmonis]CAF2912015.1 unnamed protein product [Lepeophtheirus salmonis]
MWWEIIPSFAIITTVGYMIPTIHSALNKFLTDTPCPRDCVKDNDYFEFQRDREYSYKTWFSNIGKYDTKLGDFKDKSNGWPYYSYGLEKLSDQNKTQSE